MIGRFCRCYGMPLPRRYRRQARKEYLAFAKSRKHTAKKVRAAVRKQLGYVRRDIGYLEGFMSQGLVPDRKDILKFLTILKMYGQQKYMYDHKPWQSHGPGGVRCQVRPEPGHGGLWAD